MGYHSITKYYKTLRLDLLCSKNKNAALNALIHVMQRCLDDSLSALRGLT